MKKLQASFDCPFDITARSTSIDIAFHPRSPRLIREEVAMTSEGKVWLAAVLLAVAEQDPQFVVTAGSKGTCERQRQRIPEEARRFVQSEEFEKYCEFAGLTPEFARQLSPEKAHRAYRVLAMTPLEELNRLDHHALSAA
jgi:hypothetical protein